MPLLVSFLKVYKLQKFRPNQVLYTYLLIGVVTSFIHIKHFRIQGVRTKSRRREEGAIFPSLSACLLEQVRKYLEFLDLVYNNKRVLFQFCSQQVLPPIQNSSWFFRKWRVFVLCGRGSISLFGECQRILPLASLHTIPSAATEERILCQGVVESAAEVDRSGVHQTTQSTRLE